jgi:hypothetical protein
MVIQEFVVMSGTSMMVIRSGLLKAQLPSSIWQECRDQAW